MTAQLPDGAEVGVYLRYDFLGLCEVGCIGGISFGFHAVKIS